MERNANYMELVTWMLLIARATRFHLRV